MIINIHPAVSKENIGVKTLSAKNDNTQAKTSQYKELKQLSKHYYPLVYFTSKKPKSSAEKAKRRNEFKQKQEKAVNERKNMPTLLQMLYPLKNPDQITIKEMERIENDINNSSEHKKLNGISKEEEEKILENIDSMFKFNNKDLENKSESDYFKTLSLAINNTSEDENIQPDLLFQMFKMIVLTGQDGSMLNKYLDDFNKFKQFAKETWEDFPNHHDEFYNARLAPVYCSFYLEDSNPKTISTIVISGKDTLVEKFKQKEFKFNEYLNAIKNISQDKQLTRVISNLCFNSKANGHKPLTQDKIALVELSNIYINEGKSENLLTQLEEMEKNKTLNLDELKKNYIKIFIRGESMGVTNAELEKCQEEGFINWNLSYIHTLPKALKSLKSLNNEEVNLVNLIKATFENNYENFLFDEKSEPGKSNKGTREKFSEAGLDFDKWMNNQTVQPVKFKHNNEDYEIAIWERKPKHDIFMGSYASACIAPDGTRPQGIVEALSYTMTQFAEIKDKDKTVGYARCYWATSSNNDNNEKEPVLIIDNIHYKNKEDSNKENLIKPVSDFMHIYAKQVAGKPVKTYLGKNADLLISSHNAKINNNKESHLSINVIGKTADNKYYLNSISDLNWSDITKPHNIKVYDLSESLSG